MRTANPSLLHMAVLELGATARPRTRRVIALPRAACPVPTWRGSLALLAIGWALFFRWHAKLTLELLRSDLARVLLRFAPELVGDIVQPWVLEAAGAWTFTNGGRTSLIDGTFDINSDTYKCALFLSTSNLGAASTTYAGVTNEHANANGYTTGGAAVTLSLSGTTTVTVDCTDAQWTASGGSITARFAALYEVGGNILCYCLLDSTPADVTATDGNTLTIQIHASGAFTLS